MEPSPEPNHPHSAAAGDVPVGSISSSPTAVPSTPSGVAVTATTPPPTAPTVVTSSYRVPLANIKKLTPLESIAMHRHRKGGAFVEDAVLIRELEFILNKAVSKGKPHLCRLDLYGPDTLNVARNMAALEFLSDFGFVQVTEEIERREKDVNPSSASAEGANKAAAAASPSSTPSPSSNTTAAAASSSTPSTSEFVDAYTPSHNQQLATHRHYLQLSKVPPENSAEWQRFRTAVVKGLEDLKWAREKSPSLLTILLHRFVSFQPLSTNYRVEITVKEIEATTLKMRTVVPPPSSSSQQRGESSTSAAVTPTATAAGGGDAAVGDVGDDTKDSFVVVDTSAPTANDADDAADGVAVEEDVELAAAILAAQRAGKGDNGASSGGNGAIRTNGVEETHTSEFFSLDDATRLNPSSSSSANAATSASTLYQNMLATFNMKHVGGPCAIDIAVYRQRSIRGDKLKAIGSLVFDNHHVMRREVELKDPQAPAGLPIGRITVEIESIKLRYDAYEEAARNEKKAKQQQQEGGEGQPPGRNAQGKRASIVPSSAPQTEVERGGGVGSEETASVDPFPAATAAVPWIEQQAIIDAAAKRLHSESGAHQQQEGIPPPVVGGTYDADDYF